jgi:hypothetical protein
MSATKIILKRSSVLGKRPTNQLIEAGELALNTNVDDPGVFFEVSDGSIVKAGPTAYSAAAPTANPAKGELWVDADTSKLSIGTNLEEWKSVATPFLGGSNGFSIFVAPNYEQATDAIDNDGQTIPFQTLNRAIIEIGRKVVRDALQELQALNLYTIYVINGFQTVANGPGAATISTFDVDYSPGANRTPVTQATLQQFNHPEGGLIIPRGISIVGLDLKKCELRPTYIPTYKYPGFPADYQQARNGPFFSVNQPLSAVFRWSGDSYLTNMSVRDKIAERYVTDISTDTYGKAVFRTTLPHGLQYNDFIQTATVNAPSNNPNFSDGQFYVDPIDVFTFYLSRTNLTYSSTLPVGDYVQVSDFSPVALTLKNTNLYNVLNIYPYFAPLSASGVPLEPYEFGNYSAHRLSLIKNASSTDLDLFYTKIQKAFPDEFGSQLNTGLATTQETVIVAPTSAEYTTNLNSASNLSSNNTLFSSPYLNQVNHRSNYGMANSDIDGDIVAGFRSVVIFASTAVILQKDPAAYEIFNTTDQNWITLTAYVAQQNGVEIVNVRREDQLRLLNATSLLNIRYYYETLKIDVGGTLQSTGLTDINNDFRHFGFRIRGSNSYMQAQSTYIIGAAIGSWAMNGAIMSLTNATNNFGSVAIQAEGFAGINTLSGANSPNKNFLQEGVVLPLALTENQVISDSQKQILPLGSRVIEVVPDPVDVSIQRVYLRGIFDPASILPYSLYPGTALFVEDEVAQYRGFLATDGGPTVVLRDPLSLGSYIRVRASDSTIPYRSTLSPRALNVPFIRRFIDPRTPQDKSYGFYITSTSPVSKAPEPGLVLRLDQASQTLSNTLNQNFQFDPGQYGGIAQVFSVDLVVAGPQLNSANFNNKVSDANQSTSYGVYASLSDSGVPWIQAVDVPPFGVSGYNNPAGSYTTYSNRNYYAAENNLWDALYYETDLEYTNINGPQKVAPDNANSPFVLSSVTLRNEPVADAYQGYVPDVFLPFYEQVGESTYFRGTTSPNVEIFNRSVYDRDDGTPGMGIIYYTQPVNRSNVLMTAASTVVQTAESPTLWPPLETPTPPTFGRPEIDQFTLSSVVSVSDPLKTLSILLVTDGTNTEYVRVITLNPGNKTVTVIRNYYRNLTVGTPPAQWPVNTTVQTCISSVTPQPAEYDPTWAFTKQTIFRYYQLMGFSPARMAPLLQPAFSGERILLNTNIPGAPYQGYAALTASWPVEFNSTSLIFASVHNWQYCGYPNYSRGLPKYQTNALPRKVSFDFLSTVVWGGRIAATGSVDTGNFVFSGSLRDVFTGNYFVNSNPSFNIYNNLIYNGTSTCDIVILDTIAREFNGVTTAFTLSVNGQPIDVNPDGLIVIIGGVPQVPLVAYDIVGTEIVFTEAPLAGSTSDIRLIKTV